MKRTVVLLVVAIIALTAQLRAQHSLDLKQGNADYLVPIPTALYALQAGSPAFLEPSTVRNFSVAANGTWSPGNSHGSVGFEVAPILLGDGIDLSEYLSGRLIRVLLRTRVSAAFENSSGQLKTGIGLRWMLHDDADVRADSMFEQTLIAWANSTANIEPLTASLIKNTPEYHSFLTHYIASITEYQPKIDSLRNVMKLKLWNRSVFELAVAGLYLSTTSPQNVFSFKIRRYAVYINAGLPIFESSGMLSFGASGSVGYDDGSIKYGQQGSVFARSYYGSATERAFIGVQLAANNFYHPDPRIEFGGLTNLANGLWLRAEVNSSLKSSARVAPQGKLTFAFGTPEIH